MQLPTDSRSPAWVSLPHFSWDRGAERWAHKPYRLPLGSIIVNPGFVQVFGEAGADGVRALVTSHVSAWGGCYSAGQIVAVFTGGM